MERKACRRAGGPLRGRPQEPLSHSRRPRRTNAQTSRGSDPRNLDPLSPPTWTRTDHRQPVEGRATNPRPYNANGITEPCASTAFKQSRAHSHNIHADPLQKTHHTQHSTPALTIPSIQVENTECSKSSRPAPSNNTSIHPQRTSHERHKKKKHVVNATHHALNSR